MKIPFCLPLIDYDVELEVLSCLNETGWLTSGPKVKEFEDEISMLCQTNSTICINSWTSGMLLLIRWLGLDENDEIIVPVYTYAASALAVINSNVKCVFVDVNDDFTISINEIEKAITKNTKAHSLFSFGVMTRRPDSGKNIYKISRHYCIDRGDIRPNPSLCSI